MFSFLVNGLPKRSPITVSFSDVGFRLKVPGNFNSSEIDNALNSLHDRVILQENKQLMQVNLLYIDSRHWVMNMLNLYILFSWIIFFKIYYQWPRTRGSHVLLKIQQISRIG